MLFPRGYFVLTAIALIWGCSVVSGQVLFTVPLTGSPVDPKVEKQIDSLTAAIQSNPSDPELYYQRALGYGNALKFSEAYDDITKYISSHGNKSHLYEAYIFLGKIHQVRLAQDFALQAFDRAIAIDATRRDAYLAKSEAYSKAIIVQYDEGIKFMNSALKKFPDESRLYLSRGLLVGRNGYLKKAYPDFVKVVTSIPLPDSTMMSIAYFGIGRYFISTKEYDEALVNVNKGHDFDARSREGYALRGGIYYKLKRYAEALSDFEKVEKSGYDSKLWSMMAHSYEMTGNIVAACAYYSKDCQLFHSDGACGKLKNLNCTKVLDDAGVDH